MPCGQEWRKQHGAVSPRSPSERQRGEWQRLVFAEAAECRCALAHGKREEGTSERRKQNGRGRSDGFHLEKLAVVDEAIAVAVERFD
eukprot:4172124-Pleurochrysis_carterae.AAC.1